MEIIIGFLGLIIMWLTWRVTSLQTKLNAKEISYKDFDRNFTAYQKLGNHIKKIVGGRITINDTVEFDEDIKDFQFVFNKEINDFAQTVRSIGVDLAVSNDKISMISIPGMTLEDFDEKKQYMSEKSEIIKRAFIGLNSELKNIFDPLLMINK